MEIRLHTPSAFLDTRLDKAAADANCIARIKWWMPQGARFILVAAPMSDQPATFEQHDSVIRALLELDPRARVRTARATYESLEDFDAQKAVRVA